jgi:hypothetical protein
VFPREVDELPAEIVGHNFSWWEEKFNCSTDKW